MTNRKLSLIIKGQNALILDPAENVQSACQRMWKRRVGAVLVADSTSVLRGIFTDRDAVHTLAEGMHPATTPLEAVMTLEPTTIDSSATAIDALRLMADCGFHHLPVIEAGRVVGIVSSSDFKGLELDHFEEEANLWERIA